MGYALKRRNGADPLGPWRWVAGGAGALFAYSECVIGLVDKGVAAEAYRSLTWSLVLLPFYAFLLAGLVGAVSRKGWSAVFTPVVAGLLSAWVLAVLTETGVAPFAMLVNWRLALGVLNHFDLILAGLCVAGLALVLAVPRFNRDLARVAAAAVAVYVGYAGYCAYEARSFGEHYAETMGLKDAVVEAVPQPLSPTNWRVVVEDGGHLHDTMVNLRRKTVKVAGDKALKIARVEALYRPLDKAVWRVYSRFGPSDLSAPSRRRVHGAWQAWQDTPYGWYGRYAVFDGFVGVPQVGAGIACVVFMDLRYDGMAHAERGTYVICPGEGGRARVFRPSGPAKGVGQWPGFYELVPLAGTR